MVGEDIRVGDTVLFLGPKGKSYSWVPRRTKLVVIDVDLATYAFPFYTAKYRGKHLTLFAHEIKKIG